MIEQAIYTIGQAHGGLTALIGSGNNIRLFPEAEEQEHATPRVTFDLVEFTTVSGVYVDSGWRHSRFMFTAYGATALEAKQVIDQIYACYARYGPATVSGHQIDPTGTLVEHAGPGGYDYDLKQFFEQVEIVFFHN